jgi:Skp family chaperone for outer membrane proteins
MKHRTPLLLAFLACSLAAATAQAQTAPKILIFDLSRLFEAYWKTQQEEIKLAGDEVKFEKEVTRMGKEYVALSRQMETLREQAGGVTRMATSGPGVITTGPIKVDMTDHPPSDYAREC